MEELLSEPRWREIMLATFDNYVIKRMLEQSYVVCESGRFDERELGCLAANLNCDAEDLHSVVSLACSRISKEEFDLPITAEDEEKIITEVVKYRIKRSSTPLSNYRRELGKEVKELNHNSPDLNISLDELMIFIKPFFEEVVNEVFAPKQPR